METRALKVKRRCVVTVIVIETKGLNGKDLADQMDFVEQQLRDGLISGDGWWIEDAKLRNE